MLEGRDENTVREWLKNNRHIKTITRDRAGAYAKAVEEILPDCMQVADRFHIHKNLMDYVKQILKRELPSNIKFIEDDVSKEPAGYKKNRINCG